MSKLYALIAGATMLLSAASAQAETLTIYPDATGTSTYLPLNIYYCSNNIRCQMIYPASELEALKGKSIDRLTYTITRAGGEWTSPAISVKMGTTTDTSYSGTTYIEHLTEVASLEGTHFDGYVNVPTTWSIELTKPYVYTGDNLVIDFSNTKGNGPRNWTFAGQTQSEVTALSMTSSVRQEKFLPKVTIEYSDAASTGISLSTTSLVYPLAWVGEPETLTLKLTNTGVDPVAGTLDLSGEHFEIFPAQFEPVAGGESIEFTVKYDNSMAGDFKGAITLDLGDMEPVTVDITATSIDGPEAVRTIFDGRGYDVTLPTGWSAYVEEYYIADNSFSAASDDYTDFGAGLRFESKAVAGRNSLIWNHGNPMPYSDMYSRAYFLVSPVVGGKVVIGATATDVAGVGPYVKAFEAKYDPVSCFYTIADEVVFDWDAPLSQNSWSNATATVNDDVQILLMMKYAAINYFAADNKHSGVDTIDTEVTEAAEYYNLQGVKVTNPQAGNLYIVKRGNNVTKRIIK